MTGSKLGPALCQIHRLFDDASTAGLDDASLLERFADSGDEAAFRSIVDRHGPMVLATSRATLRDASMAEDAFQATFLVLARRARSIHDARTIGGWLHRVARRVANRANLDAATRHRREREAGSIRASAHINTRDELASTLHEEIDRLPERYRMPVVLCHLEGLTHAEAAHRLRKGERTLRRHLSEALPRLRSRLVRRGVSLSVAGLIANLAGQARAAVPESWVMPSGSAGGSAAGLATRAMAASAAYQAKIATVAAIGLIATACLVATQMARVDGAAPTPGSAQAGPAIQARTDPPAGHWTFAGKVVDPDGRPFEGATIYLDVSTDDRNPGLLVRARSGPDGLFRFAAARLPGDNNDVASRVHLVAVADGFGLGLSDGDDPDADRDLTIRLAQDDSPIEGRVVDLEGRPVAGASARVVTFWAPESQDMTAWIAAAKVEGQAGYAARTRFLRTRVDPMDDPTLFRPAVTDADGRFRLIGIGRERLVDLKVEGPTIRPVMVSALTRRMPGFQVPEVVTELSAGVMTFQGSTLDLVASPSRPVEGTIRDVDTGRPINGVTLVDFKMADYEVMNSRLVQARTDQQGRYRLAGLPRGAGNVLMVVPPSGEPYLPSTVAIPDAPGLGPIALDLTLKRGTWAKGKVVDKRTGRPIRASVLYHAAADNPHLAGTEGFREVQYFALQDLVGATEDGSYRVAVLPGRGMLAVNVYDVSYPFSSYQFTQPDSESVVPLVQALLHAKARLDVPEKTDSIAVDFELDPGRSMVGTVVDPDGRPITGTLVYGLGTIGNWDEPMTSPRFMVYSLRPPVDEVSKVDEVRTLLFRHEGKKLAGWRDVRWDEPEPLTVRLEAWSEIVGRVVNASGRPVGNAAITAYVVGKKRRGGGMVEHSDRRILTDADGRFRLEGVAPGLPHQLHVSSREGTEWIQVEPVAPGKVFDRGEIKVGASK